LRITPLASPRLVAGELGAVERVVRAAFSKRRKTLANALRGSDLALDAGPAALEALLRGLGIDPRARAESLSPEVLLQLSRALVPAVGGDAAGPPWT
jgi:16S rRNA (adenine1518-N6/adenine1519-N6)-dimethyltransferase